MKELHDRLDQWASWLTRGVSGKILYVIALHFDALILLAQVAVWSRFPGLYSYETLPLHQRARRIRQGIGESNLAYSTRLTKYLDQHEAWGGPYPLLDEIWHHYKDSPGGPFRVHLIYQSGAYFQLQTDGSVLRTDVAVTTGVEDWAHWWLVYEWPTAVADDGLWDDDGAWDDPDGAWDTALPYSQCADIRLIPSEWNNAHSIGHIILLGPDQALWDIPDESWDVEDEWDAGGDADLVEMVVD